MLIKAVVVVAIALVTAWLVRRPTQQPLDDTTHRTRAPPDFDLKDIWTLDELNLRPCDTFDASVLSPSKTALFIEKQLLKRRQPVLLRNMPYARTWELPQRWTSAYLRQHIDVLSNVLANSTTGAKFFYVDNLKPLLAKSAGAVRWTQPYQVLAAVQADAFVGLNVTRFGHQMYFSRTVADVSAVLSADVASFREVLPSEAGPVKMWMSSPGVTARLHNDNSDNLFNQVVGRKRFVLFDPRAWRDLYMFSSLHPASRQSQVDVHALNITRFPRFRAAWAHGCLADLTPGDALYLPALWFHDVQSVDWSVSVMAFMRPHHKNVFARAAYGHELPLNVQPAERQHRQLWIWLALVADAMNMTELALWQGAHAREAPSLNRVVARGAAFMAELASTRYAHLHLDPMLIGAYEAIVAGESAHVAGSYCGADREAFLRDRTVQAELSALRPLAAAVAADFDILEPGVREISFANYAEELVASLVPPLDVYRFVRDCFVRPLEEQARASP